MATLIDKTIEALKAEGKINEANEAYDLFVPVKQGDMASAGSVQLFNNLQAARQIDSKRGANERKLEVEHALVLTLKKNSIDVPKTIMSLMADFHPSDASAK